MPDTLLVEVRTEELPPPAVSLLARRFPQALLKLLAGRGFVDINTPCSDTLATPRRFAALVGNVRGQTKSQNVKRRGPQLKDCYDNGGKPSAALQGFMRAVGETDVDKLGRENENGRDYIIWQGTKQGIVLGEVLAGMVSDSLGGIGELAAMRWNDKDYAFVRPVRGLIMMHGKNVISGEVMGAISADKTRGHPALANDDIVIANAGEYAETLREAKIIVDCREREREIHKDAFVIGAIPYCGGVLKRNKLIAEAAEMCEYPLVYPCAIDKEFWQLPRECVASCLIAHQKSLPFLAQENNALCGFFFFADNAPENPEKIINGVNAVVRARLRDIAFYLQADKKLDEKTAQEKLGGIVYHHKLGSQKERAERIIKLAAAIGKILKLNNDDNAKLHRAAEVCKLDLPTMMVGEYPELAGKMAAIYFCDDDTEIKAIVKRHGNDDFAFYPGSDNMALPSIALFLADKLEKIAGMFIIGEKPAGRKDPHGLRRAAGQIAQILALSYIEIPAGIAAHIGKISITELIEVARGVFAGYDKQNADGEEMREFIARRVSWSLDINAETISTEVINAVYALRPDYLAQIPRRCKALQNFLLNPQAAILIAANKRINNILRKSPPADASFSPDLLREDAERALYECITRLEQQTGQLAKDGDYESALTLLAKDAAKPIGDFFDNCMVNAEDAKIRANRLALLARLRVLLNIVADLALV
ncbi:MAG: glycine--tRNA ligase subunit beta [Gammaproteobacteria bacterium]